MKVTRLIPISGEIVEVEGCQYAEYERYSADCWYVRIGESLEPVYDTDAIERAYQEFRASMPARP